LTSTSCRCRTARCPPPSIPAYRHKWLDAVFAHEPIEAVVALGTLADKAWLK
jgi:hypothetical protein